MILKVRYSEINDFSKVMEKDSKIIDDEITNILTKLDELTNIWQGSDSAQFHDHATAYFKTMRNIPITMRNMIKSIGAAVDGYKTSEEALAKNVNAQVAEYPKVGNRMEKATAFSDKAIYRSEKMSNITGKSSPKVNTSVSDNKISPKTDTSRGNTTYKPAYNNSNTISDIKKSTPLKMNFDRGVSSPLPSVKKSNVGISYGSSTNTVMDKLQGYSDRFKR